MTALTIYSQDGHKEATHHELATISSILNDIGVQFEHWQANQPLDDDAGQEEVIAAYKDSIDTLSQKISV